MRRPNRHHFAALICAAMSQPLLERRWPWLLAAGLILVAFASTFVDLTPRRHWDDRPTAEAAAIPGLAERDDVNLLFILIDTLRAERMSAYGYERETTPGIDHLARHGIRFARHLAQSSWTKCSMASLWTGYYPSRTDITRFDQMIPQEAVLPAEILSEAGFKTAGIYRNGWVAPTFGFDQGFEVYTRPAPVPMGPGVTRQNPTLTDRGTDEGPVLAAFEFLRAHRNERWFLYLHLMDVHEYLYDQESALFGATHADIYDNSIRHTDDIIQVLLAHLADKGLLEKTIVVISSDHGEAFGERGYDGHAREVFRETTEVPFIIALPFQLESGLVIESRSRNVDVWPTLLDLLGLEMPGDLDGRSRLPEVLAAAGLADGVPPDDTAVAHLDQFWSRPEVDPKPTVAVAEGDFRYVRLELQDGKLAERLFDASRDPAELVNRADDEPEVLARLREEAEAYLEAEPAWGVAPTRELDEMELNHLRALGYALP